jgi:long-chain acyl-CoA synthetase
MFNTMPNNIETPHVMTLVDMLEKNKNQIPLKTALVCEQTSLSWGDLHQKAMKLAHYLVSLGVSRGDRIALMMDAKTPDLIIGFLASAACGTVVVPVDCNQPDHHIQQLLNIVSPSAALVSERVLDRFDPADHGFPDLYIMVCGNASGGVMDQPKEKKAPPFLADILNAPGLKIDHPPETIDPEDVAYFNLTSGTTGFPKCAVTTHAVIYWNTVSAVEQLALTPDDIHLCMFPPATHPHEIFARPLFLGGTMVLTDHISPRSLTAVIEENKVTFMMAIAPIYGVLTKHHKKTDFRFSTLKTAESGGMHLDPVTAAEFRKKFGFPIIPVWGSTETAGIALAMPLGVDSKPGSCGIPGRYYQVAVVDERGKRTGPGEIGEMIVRGKGVCSAYYQNEPETRKNFKDGWYYTNDMFFQDKDGFFYFSGRRNGMMKVAGLKVFPVEIEDLLIQHPAIREVCVIRAEDPIHGEIPKAIVVLEEGAGLTLKALRDYCAPRIAAYKIPKMLELRSSLPRNPVGKILIHKL